MSLIDFIEMNENGELVTVTREVATASKWAWEQNPANPAAYPVMSYLNFIGGWSIAEWMQWHGAMKSALGITQANYNFILAWADDNVVEGPPLQARVTNTAFKEYAKANGFYDGLFNGLGVIMKPVNAAVDVVDSVSKAAETTAKMSEYLLPAAVLIAAAVLAAPYAAPHIRRALKAIR